MPIALTPKKEHQYILEAERNSESPTVFTIRALSSVEMSNILDKHGSTGALVEFSRIGIVTWDNFNDEFGSAVRCEKMGGRLSDKSMSRLTLLDLSEIGAQINSISNATADDLGK